MDFRGHRNLKANKRTWLITKSRMGVDYLLQLASQAVKLVPFSWPGLARRYKVTRNLESWQLPAPCQFRE